MPKLRFGQFSGEIPKLLSRLLPDTGSQHAENVRLDDGGLTPVRKSRMEYVFDTETSVKTIYKWGDVWIGWDKAVSVVPGPVATNRLYFTGDGAPKMRVGTTVYDLAVPRPSVSLTATVTGTGTGDVTTRLYAYTWLTSFGEESEPNPISFDVAWRPGQTVTLSGFQAIPAGRGITKQRIYRSQSSSQVGTDLFLIEERDAATSNFVDVYDPTEFMEPIPSKDYNQPPADLSGLIAMPNGMMAAFSGKQLCFSEPYKPHAWPEKYRLTAAFDIVALGCYGSTVVAGTKGYPYVVSGISPESMVEEKIEVNLPCVNAGGLVDLGYSIAYPSNDGLVVVSNGGATVATESLFTRPDWQKLSPSTIVSGQFAGRYFASYSYTDIDGVTKYEGTMAVDLTGQQPFIVRYAFKADSFFYDLASGQLYYCIGNTVFEFDAIGEVNEVMTWKSKRVVMSNPVTLGAILVESGEMNTPEHIEARKRQIAEIVAYNEPVFSLDSMGSEIDGSAVNAFSLAGDQLASIPPDKWISVKVYADGRLIRTVSEIDNVKRIKAQKARVWEVMVNGTAEVEQVLLATTAHELTED